MKQKQYVLIDGDLYQIFIKLVCVDFLRKRKKKRVKEKRERQVKHKTS
jgi:hypothetical protein